MRSFFVAFTSLMLLSAGTAQAKVDITVDKNNQQMTVVVDGVTRYHWPVSTGIPSRETPAGSFRAFRMEEDHYSKEFDDAPMPHSIFFTKVGHAIHGTDSVGRLGTPASHGCVRLSRQNASTLYALVQEQGVLNTTVTLTGSAQVALARNPRGRTNNAVARAEQPAEEQYATTGDPVNLAPPMQPPRRYMPQDDNYIYPADGSDTGARYPAPRPIARPPGAQVYQQLPQPQPSYGSDPVQAHQGYYYQQQQPRQYYQPRNYYYQN
ncbi:MULTISPECIES: L,D-transpeptidase [unclassified Bradyrhizobium]|uniref:L,D-transpeptidase n=1 Tax=unclassified Bradyrhizobium TaxID=2631580 RepID=UPI0020B42D7A|nr:MULTISPECIES: L,D-transpeptidase [unclassified Bradyrhizobium]MCP3385106.1 L,D-transpeptidase [Bradyrhizobium sp. CCGUVB4N]MCP3446369.1 L,D-transpeptidase [Bradyrhizobium sp. CCGUVB14]